MGCACIGPNKIKINSCKPNQKAAEPCFSEDEKECEKFQKELEENILIIISSSQSIESIKDTSDGDFLGYFSFISNLGK